MKKEDLELNYATMQSFVLCPFILITLDCQRGEERVNLATFSYVGVASEKPPIITVAIRPGRYSHGLVLKTGEFTLNLPSREMLIAMDCFGTISGRKSEKFSICNIALESPTCVKPPIIKDSPISLECELLQTLFLSKNGASHDLFLAKVVKAHRQEGFEIERHPAIVTTNFSYRVAGEILGRAHKVWRKEQGGA